MRQPVTLCAMPWYHGKISREDVEKLLYPKKNGLFLIRDSNVYVGDYTLCVCCNESVEHYHIAYANNQLSIDNETFFRNLEELVQPVVFDLLKSNAVHCVAGKSMDFLPPRSETRRGLSHQCGILVSNYALLQYDVVNHYSNDADGLCSRLITPLTKQGGKFGIVSMNDFKHGGWVIHPQDLKLGAYINRGNFGDVYQGLYKGQIIAAKQLKDTERGEQPFLLEAAVMTSLNHSNVLKIIGITEDTIILLTEFMEKGNLLEYLQTRGRLAVTDKVQINFAWDICSGMEYLNNVGLIHRDLAARNILLSSNGEAKVSDFGLANFHGLSLTSRKFPVKWTAPEALKNNIFTSKSDMWSFGILLWEIYSFGRVPYPKITHSDVEKYIEGGYRMEAPEGCPEEIYTIMKHAWEMKPENRPTFKEVFSKLNNLRSIVV